MDRDLTDVSNMGTTCQVGRMLNPGLWDLVGEKGVQMQTHSLLPGRLAASANHFLSLGTFKTL